MPRPLREFKLFLFCLALIGGASLYFRIPSSLAEPATPPAADSSQAKGGIAFNDPAHAVFFKYQAYLANSRPYKGRMFGYFRIYLGPDGGWMDDDRLYPEEHWYTPNNEESWKNLTPDQQTAKIQWTENALAHLFNHFMEDPAILADSQPNSQELAELIRSVWGKDSLKKFKDLQNAYEEREDPKKKSNYDKALAAAQSTLKEIASTLPPLAAPAAKPAGQESSPANPPNVSSAAASSGTPATSTAAPATSPISISTAPAAAPPGFNKKN